jgi:hypothetical protein
LNSFKVFQFAKKLLISALFLPFLPSVALLCNSKKPSTELKPPNFQTLNEFFDKKLQIRITGSDIFRTESEYPYYSNYRGYGLNGRYIEDARRFGLGATYKFGNAQAKTKIKTDSALDEELNRIEN